MRLTLILFLLTPLFAQTDSSSLEGRVTDQQGGSVAGAQIRLVNQSTGAERKVTTGTNGSYIFNLITSGRYDVEATSTGFKTFRDTGIQVDALRCIGHGSISL